MKDPLKALIKQEVPHRLMEVLEVDPERVTPELKKDIVNRLSENSDIMFDYDAIDNFIAGILKEYGVPNNLDD